MYRVFVETREGVDVISIQDWGDEDLSKKLTTLKRETNFVRFISIEHWGDEVWKY